MARPTRPARAGPRSEKELAKAPPGDLTFAPLTADRWKDFETLFGPRGACGGCWCMWARETRAEYERRKGDANKRAMRALVRSGTVPGILAYLDGAPVGWCAIAPRESYPALERSRTLKRVDDRPVWSIVCFFIARPYRRRGLSDALLEAALEHARTHGARLVEGYPVQPTSRWGDAFVWRGTVSVFERNGFVEVVRRGAHPIVRRAMRG